MCIQRCTPSDRTPRTPDSPASLARSPSTVADAGAAPVMIIRSLPPRLACEEIRDQTSGQRSDERSDIRRAVRDQTSNQTTDERSEIR